MNSNNTFSRDRISSGTNAAQQPVAKQPDPLTGHVVPTYKLPNPLREPPQRSRFKRTVLPKVSMALLCELAFAVSVGAIPLVLFGVIALASLWLATVILD